MSIRPVQAYEQQTTRVSINSNLSKIMKIALAAILTIAFFVFLHPPLSIIISAIVIAFAIIEIKNINNAVQQTLHTTHISYFQHRDPTRIEIIRQHHQSPFSFTTRVPVRTGQVTHPRPFISPATRTEHPTSRVPVGTRQR